MAELGGGADRRWWMVPEKVPLHAAMVALQFGYAGFHVVSRLALDMGISKLVFPLYRNLIALSLLLPFAYFLEKKERPPLSATLLLQFFFLALVGITGNQGFYLLGLENTSPTFASAIQNSVPAITFFMAAILGIEKVKVGEKEGAAKVGGTMVCVGGASVITLYKGPVMYNNNNSSNMKHLLSSSDSKSWTQGCVFLICHCLCWSAWLVLQSPLLKKYPARLSLSSFTCLFGLLQFLAISLFFFFFNHHYPPLSWRLHSSSELFTLLYAGVVASGVAYAVQIWCIQRGGPVFVALYQPVQTMLVAVMASLAFGEEFHLGGVIGAVLIVGGLYLVLWGKSQEGNKLSKLTKTMEVEHVKQSHNLHQPLLFSQFNQIP